MLGGLFGALLLLEAVLQLAALYVSTGEVRPRGLDVEVDRDRVRILCLGESTTHGFGQASYPTLLEQLLEERIPEVSFEVINAGLPGTHSLYLAEQLDSWLITHDPDWLVVMMGINDEIYFTDLQLLAGHGRWEALLLRSRVYKLARLLWSRFASDLPEEPGGRAGGERAGNPTLSGEFPAVEVLRQYRRTFDAARREWFDGARSRAALVFAELIEQARAVGAVQADGTLVIPPEYWSVYERSQRLLSEFLVADERVGEALELSRQSVELHPENPRLRRRLIWILEVVGNDPEASAQRRVLERLEEESALEVTVESWRRVLATARRTGTNLVAVQYPLRSVARLRRMLGDADDVIYVENRRNFEAALARSGWDAVFVDRFSGDFGHATELGNFLIAEELLRDVFLPRYGQADAPGTP